MNQQSSTAITLEQYLMNSFKEKVIDRNTLRKPIIQDCFGSTLFGPQILTSKKEKSNKPVSLDIQLLQKQKQTVDQLRIQYCNEWLSKRCDFILSNFLFQHTEIPIFSNSPSVRSPSIQPSSIQPSSIQPSSNQLASIQTSSIQAASIQLASIQSASIKPPSVELSVQQIFDQTPILNISTTSRKRERSPSPSTDVNHNKRLCYISEQHPTEINTTSTNSSSSSLFSSSQVIAKETDETVNIIERTLKEQHKIVPSLITKVDGVIKIVKKRSETKQNQSHHIFEKARVAKGKKIL